MLVAGRGRGRGREGVGREGLLVALTAQGPVAPSGRRVLPCRDGAQIHPNTGWAQPWEQGKPLGLQEVAGSRAELIPVALTCVKGSREALGRGMERRMLNVAAECFC